MKRIVAAGLLTVLIVFLASCESSQSNIPSAMAATSTPPQSTAPAPQAAGFVASGPLVVENQIDVAAQREGVISKILVDSGTPVKNGTILALLDDRQISSDLEAARAKTRSIAADLKNWESEAKVLDSDHERARKMWDAGLITKEQYEHARYKAESDQWDVKRVEELLENAKATEHSLQLESDKTRIRAPFAGIVARRYVRVGQKVALGDRTFWVTSTGPLRVRFTLPEKYVNTMKKGQELSVGSPDVPELKQVARVIQVSPVVDPASGTIEVVAEIVRPPKELRPGMTVNVHIDSR